MYDIHEFNITGKEIAILVLVGFVLLLGAGFAGYLLGWERAEDVYCNGSGTESVGQQLEQAGTNISNATSGIGQAENHVGNVQAGINNAQESTDYLQGTVSTSTELIADCKRILEAIRQRANTDKVTH
jgi:peptidoglycan hydrolase CwlO-like protein